MTAQPSIVELLAGYSTYTTADELNMSSAIDAPATTFVCVGVTIAESAAASTVPCAASAGGAVGDSAGVTFAKGC